MDEHSEILDYYDDRMIHLGTASRQEIHDQGHWHRVFHCWLIHDTALGQSLVFQMRGADKALSPGELDVTVGGHLTQGESVEDGAREISEELGIVVAGEELWHFGMRRESVELAGMINNEFCDLHMLLGKHDLLEYPFNPHEVDGLVEIPLEEALAFFSLETNSVQGRLVRTNEQQLSDEKISLTLNAFVDRPLSYYAGVCELALSYLRGRTASTEAWSMS